MIPVSLLGFGLFLIKHKSNYFLNPAIIKAIILGFSLPSFDFMIKIILSIYYNFTFSISDYFLNIPYFHSIFTITLLLLLIKTVSEFLNKKISNSTYTGVMTGYFLYVFLELLFVSNSLYIFWPIIDSDLAMPFRSLLGVAIESQFYNFVFLFISLELFLFLLVSKLLTELAVKGFLYKDNFLAINRWHKFQKKLFIATIIIGIIIVSEIYINKNLLLSIYMLFYILSTIQYLIIILNLNLGVKAARTN